LCFLTLVTTFTVQSTFGINGQTRLFRGLWKHPRLDIRQYKKWARWFLYFLNGVVFTCGMHGWGFNIWILGRVWGSVYRDFTRKSALANNCDHWALQPHQPLAKICWLRNHPFWSRQNPLMDCVWLCLFFCK
jgi:hypothetical protein